MLFRITLLLTFVLYFSEFSFSQEEINFEYMGFVKDQSIDSVDMFIFNYLNGDSLTSNIYSSIPEIDVGPLYEDENGNMYLGNLRKFVLPYTSNPDSLLALGFYLKKHYNLKNSIYDQLLRQCIILDRNYNRAIFLLAELRFKKGGYVEDAYFLISVLKKRLPRNKEINRLYEYFENRVGGNPIKPKSFKDYLYKDYYYVIED